MRNADHNLSSLPLDIAQSGCQRSLFEGRQTEECYSARAYKLSLLLGTYYWYSVNYIPGLSNTMGGDYYEHILMKDYY